MSEIIKLTKRSVRCFCSNLSPMPNTLDILLPSTLLPFLYEKNTIHCGFRANSRLPCHGTSELKRVF